MAPGWKARMRKRESALKGDPLTEAVMLLLSLGWEPAGRTTTEIVKHRSADGTDKKVAVGQRRRFILPRTPRICTVGGRTTCFYMLDHDRAPIDFMNIPTKSLDEIKRIAIADGCDLYGRSAGVQQCSP
jgi:hypothetical protein